jgi:tRNA dimethylallyltransferase
MRQAAENAGHQSGALTISPPAPGLVIAGPTGSGKTALAVELARRLGAELVSADSRQVYRGLDAGTAKEVSSGVAQHLLDIATPDETYDVGRFLRESVSAVAEIRARAKLPIVVGGTGLYIKAFLEGLSDLPPRDENIRARLSAEWDRDGEAPLRERLAHADPKAERTIPKGNKQRLIRALEVLELTGEPISASWEKREGRAPGEWLALRIEWPAEELRARLESRCARMWPTLLSEVRALKRAYTGREPGFESLGYREALAVLDGSLGEPEGRARFVAATLAYAKRQRTWFRAQLDAETIAGGPLESMTAQALRLVEKARA